MRVIARIVSATVLAASMASAGSMVGWISDASCGASNGNGSREARECAKRASRTEPPRSSSAKLIKRSTSWREKPTAKEHLDHKVQISGEVKGDTITVTDIKKAS